MSAFPKVSVYILGLTATFLFLLLIKTFNVSYPLNLMITNTTKTTEFSVVGEGKVEVVPDTVYVDLGISVANVATAEEAQSRIDEVNNKLIASLKTLGVSEKDIKTSSYNVSPAYDYFPNTENKITGYNGNASVIVKLKDVKLATQVLAEATKVGANQVGSTRFEVSDPQKYREEARNKAIENAKKQAEKLSKDLGIALGKITNIVESSPGQVYPVYGRAESAMVKIDSSGPDLSPGTQTVTSTVTLYFEKK